MEPDKPYLERYKPSELFRSTTPFYALYRSGYPSDFFNHMATRFKLDGTQRVLDLGCGTGQIAIPLAQHVGEVIAVDPEPSMLDAGRSLAEAQSIDNVRWLSGDSYRLSELALPTLNLVTMGASFHWTDRHALLNEFDHLILPEGAVVVVSGGPPEAQKQPPWSETITAVRTKFLGPERRAGSGTYSHPEERHADVLAQSPFSHIETARWHWTIERDLDSLVGLQFSFSFSAPALFDSESKRMEFEHELREALATKFPSKVFREEIITEALIATRQ